MKDRVDEKRRGAADEKDRVDRKDRVDEKGRVDEQDRVDEKDSVVPFAIGQKVRITATKNKAAYDNRTATIVGLLKAVLGLGVGQSFRRS